jgi:hypothetical protein
MNFGESQDLPKERKELTTMLNPMFPHYFATEASVT